MILVTGGTGLVGSHLIFKLLQTHNSVRGIYRREHKLALVKHVFSYYTNDVENFYNRIEWVEADLNNIPDLEKAFEGVHLVYHCAAFVSFEPDKYHLLRKINIEGTANIVNLCIANKVKKLCYVSSIAALGSTITPEKPITENNKWNPEADNSVYAITKYGAEIEVWRGSQENLEVVVVNPGVIIGPGYWKSGGSSSLMRQVYKGMPYYTEGSTGYVDVSDVVNAMILLMDSDIKNERFILVSENLTFKYFLEKTSKLLGVKPPQKEASKFLLSIGWRLDWINNKLFGKRRKMSKQMAQSLQTKSLFSNEKIKRILNFEFMPMEKSIKQTAELFLKDQKSNP
ncbi:Nucleoside-diphosphate-sugar epimerase [Flavobacteriaceae bacterium MAR_2010_188]|nr:Nucleoside-diphosphate-sugar epimerase [Flavobacteriaceae bacterium MAR_2010_188]